jgi:hypothetical protein
MIATMANAPSAVANERRASVLSPVFSLGCGVALMLGGALVYWLEPAPAVLQVPPEKASVPEGSASRSLQRVLEREAQARAEQARRDAEDAAERARRSRLEIDGAAVAEARNQRAELARRQAEALEMQRMAAETEDGWKRFYKPSAACSDSSAAATVECVNEYVKAKREFQSRMAARAN